jgi:cytoskeletal protein CcmA (bactofilin family)
MTMFTRNDKAPDQPGRPAGEKPDVQPPVVVESKRPSEAAVTAPVYGGATGGIGAPTTSIISKALKITGQLESTENIQIDGEIDGDVRGIFVKVGNNARVKGSVFGDQVELAGTVDGKIEAKKVILTSSARMSGDIIHQDITIESGAFIAGHCKPDYGKDDTKSSAVQLKPKEASVSRL